MDNDIRKLNEMLNDKRELYKKYDYCIDLNTNQVKENYLTASYLDTYYEPKNAVRHRFLNKYLIDMRDYHKFIKDYLNKEYNKIDTLNDDIINFNIYFDVNYYSGFNVWLKDLLDNDIKQQYLNNDISLLTMAQVDNIKKIGYDTFINIDILNDTSDNNDILKDFLDIPTLIKIQDKVKEDLNNGNISDNYNPISNVIYLDIKEVLSNKIDNDIKDYNDIYKKAHKLYAEINATIKDVINKFKKDLDTLDYNLIVSDTPIIKTQLKIPKSINIDKDILKLFNNIYPNYQYKSIDDNRHKDIDIKAELMLDLNNDNIYDMEDMRLINFLQSGNIQLFPIQSALINGFISIRDENRATDKTIPLLSTLKYITENKTMRLPTRQKDLALYEDFMLFFNRCKIKIKIIDRKSNKVYFEILEPIPLLANTPAYKEDNYGYIIGNSVLNILKNELDTIYSTPKQTTHLINKQYLNPKLPNNPPTINLTNYIYPTIATMINTYKTKKTYQPKIDITCLYNFQALYREKPKASKKDKQDVRDMLNVYLDYLITKGLITSYEPIIKGKEINAYKIEINKNAKI